MKHTIAVTGLHSGENPQPGVGVIRSLRRRYPDLTIIGLVYDVLESGIYLEECADVVYNIPYPAAGSEAVLNRLEYIHAHTPIDVLIPTLDAEILAMIQLQDVLEDSGIRMLLPTQESVNTRQKSELPDLVSACNVQTPRCRKVVDVAGLLAAAEEFTYPMVIKGPYYEAHKVDTQYGLLDQFYALMGRWGAPIILQEYILGPEFNVMAVGDGTGNTAGFCAIRKMIVSLQGKGYGGIVIHDETLNAASMALIEHLQWRGPCELEFIQDECDGTVYLLEINPRFPAWVDFPSTFGFNMPALVIEELLEGGMKPLPPCDPGYFYIRHTADITCRVEDMGQLTTFGEWECRSHRDLPEIENERGQHGNTVLYTADH